MARASRAVLSCHQERFRVTWVCLYFAFSDVISGALCYSFIQQLFGGLGRRGAELGAEAGPQAPGLLSTVGCRDKTPSPCTPRSLRPKTLRALRGLCLGTFPTAGVPSPREPVQKVLLFSSPGMIESVPQPNRMWSGWLPAAATNGSCFQMPSGGQTPQPQGTRRPWRGVLDS